MYTYIYVYVIYTCMYVYTLYMHIICNRALERAGDYGTQCTEMLGTMNTALRVGAVVSGLSFEIARGLLIVIVGIDQGLSNQAASCVYPVYTSMYTYVYICIYIYI